MKEIDSSVSPEIFTFAPGYERVVVYATVNDVTAGAEAANDLMERVLKWIMQQFSGADLLAVPEIESWRSAFRNAGINPSKFRPAIEALLRRAVRGENLNLASPLVDLGTAISLLTFCPVGMHTVDHLTERLELRTASGTERFDTFAGARENPDVGEVIYTSGATVLTRRWAWRQGAIGSIAPHGSQQLAANIDVMGEVDHAEAIDLLVDGLTRCGATGISHVTLTSSSPSARLRWATP